MVAKGALNFLRSQSTKDVDVIAQVGADTSTSSPVLYTSGGAVKVIPVQNLIIQIDTGKVIGYIWESGCDLCSTCGECITANLNTNSTTSYSYFLPGSR